MVIWLYNVVCSLKQSVERLERRLSSEADIENLLNTPPPEQIPDTPKAQEEEKSSHIWDKTQEDPEPIQKTRSDSCATHPKTKENNAIFPNQ